MAVTKEMTVANLAFLLDRLAADTPVNQQIRELTQNSLESIARRQKDGDTTEGRVRWDVDWDYLRRTGKYKLSITDNGDGMSPEQMSQYLNALAVQGANQTQSISQNFGVGAKITALFRNRYGLVYQSWRDGKGTMVKLHRDDKRGVYGLAAFDLADGPHWTPKITDATKPPLIENAGTKVTLLGAGEDDNTCFPPEEVGTAMNWLVRYLTTRYFRLPPNLKLQVRVLTRDEGRWPEIEPKPSEKTFNLQTIKGLKDLYDDYANKSGTVSLATADAHWWVFDDAGKASKDMSSRGSRACSINLVFQDEVYIQRIPPSARRVLATFGIIFGAEHVAICIEPRTGSGLDVRADTARSRVFINGEDIEEANWWETWGSEFRSKLPAEVRAKIEEVLARTENNADGKSRERTLERLKRIRELLRPTRYRRDPQGLFLAAGEFSGGITATRSTTDRVTTSNTGSRGGRGGLEYLADLVDVDGEQASEVTARVKEPEVRWVSRADATRDENELEDVGAELAGDVLTADIVKANADFRGYLDIISEFNKEFNPAADPTIGRKIIDHVREWLDLQLIEAIMTVRNLANGRTWTSREVGQALSPQALTAVMLSRYHVIEKVRRSLGSELARPTTRVA